MVKAIVESMSDRTPPCLTNVTSIQDVLLPEEGIVELTQHVHNSSHPNQNIVQQYYHIFYNTSNMDWHEELFEHWQEDFRQSISQFLYH